MKDIPIHRLDDRQNCGLELKHFTPEDMPMEEIALLGLHRDDHYVFFLTNGGLSSVMVDFTEVQVHASSVYYILPGQIHYPISN